jgi:flagellar hook-associated protein 3 FlgL
MVSSDYRVTQQTMAARSTANLQQMLQQLQQLQGEISSNKRIQKPSDDPVGTVSALRLRNDLDRSDQIGRNISDAQGWLGTADDALNNVVAQIQQIRDLALQAQNGTLSQPELDAIGQQLDAARSTLLSLANTKYGDRYIFSGTAAGAAYDANGNYTGQSAAIERTVAPGQRVQINVNGDAVFGANGSDLFSLITTLSADVRAGNTGAIANDVTSLDTHTQTIQSNLALVGARTNSVSTMKDRNDAGAVTMKQNLSDVEDIDLPKVLMDFQSQQVAYQAALSATAKVIQPSLADFLQ